MVQENEGKADRPLNGCRCVFVQKPHEQLFLPRGLAAVKPSLSTNELRAMMPNMPIFGSVNIAMFDWPWSGIHFLSGLCVGLMLGFVRGWRPTRRFWTIGILVLVIWELIERTLRFLDIHAHDTIAPFKASVASFAFGEETWANTIGDVIIGSVGLLFGRWVTAFRQPKSPHQPL